MGYLIEHSGDGSEHTREEGVQRLVLKKLWSRKYVRKYSINNLLRYPLGRDFRVGSLKYAFSFSL